MIIGGNKFLGGWVQILKKNHWVSTHADDAYVRIITFPLDFFFGIQFNLGHSCIRRGFTIYLFCFKIQVSIESRLNGLNRYYKLQEKYGNQY